MPDARKMTLSATELSEGKKAFEASAEEFLQPDKLKSNVVGMGVGVKWRDGTPTGEPALIVLVSQKLDKNQLSRSELVPARLGSLQTDVLAIGQPQAGQGDIGIETLAKRVRPAQGGYSVGHYKITAGTIATMVYDILPGGKVSPPAHGVGIPAKYYILSNNHVLANINAALIGDPILQPGPFDGGIVPADVIARLSRFIPITLEPPTPRALHNNLVDCAVAEGEFHDLNRLVYWNGHVRGWRQKAGVAVGVNVEKNGRHPNFPTGRITGINATGGGGYGGGLEGRQKG